jgi:hypothetical protein
MFEFRFWSKVLIGDGCWIWTASLDGKGYGQYWRGDRKVIASRHAYEIWCGPLSSGVQVLHRCDTPACVRPDHLFEGSQRDNAQDCVEKGRHYLTQRTHCPDGHEYDEENTYWYGTRRRCRKCLAKHQRASYRRRHS